MTRNRIRPWLAMVPLLALVACSKSGEDKQPAVERTPASSATSGAGSTTASSADPTTSAPSAAAVDPCALVTKQDAEKLAGTPLDPPQKVRETCTYTGPVTGPTAQVEVFVGDGAKKFLDIDRELGHAFTTLSGIGDEAYLEDGAVFVNGSGVWVSVRLVLLNDPAENRKPLENVARMVATRL